MDNTRPLLLVRGTMVLGPLPVRSGLRSRVQLHHCGQAESGECVVAVCNVALSQNCFHFIQPTFLPLDLLAPRDWNASPKCGTRFPS